MLQPIKFIYKLPRLCYSSIIGLSSQSTNDNYSYSNAATAHNISIYIYNNDIKYYIAYTTVVILYEHDKFF